MRAAPPAGFLLQSKLREGNRILALNDDDRLDLHGWPGHRNTRGRRRWPRTGRATRPGVAVPSFELHAPIFSTLLAEALHAELTRSGTLVPLSADDAVVDCLDVAASSDRRLAEANPAAYLPDLAMSLAARATTLRGLDTDLAISSMQEAVGYWTQLAGQIPDAFGPWLVQGMTDLADLLEDAGRVADAEEIRVALRPPS